MTGDSTGHNFIGSYIGTNSPQFGGTIGLRDHIRADIVAQTSTVANSGCPLDCAPHTLGPSTSSIGGTYDFGKIKRTVKVRFTISGQGGQGGVTAYNASNTTLAATPLNSTYQTGCAASGTYTYTFAYDPAVLGTTQLSVGGDGCGNANALPAGKVSICIDCVDPTTGASSCD